MRAVNALIVLLFTSVILSLVSCAPPAEKLCSVDNDCTGTSCCHVSDAVNREHGPDCTGVLCTSQCEPGTTDCGQGAIKCVEGQCVVVLNNG